jgi:DNA-binding beta-propeller fold protein YncE
VRTGLAKRSGFIFAAIAVAALLSGLTGCDQIGLRDLLDKLANGTAHMYFTERDAGRISVAETNGKNILAIGGLGADTPIMLAVDLDAEQLYWTDHDGSNHFIRRAGLDGSSPQTLYADSSGFLARGICLVLSLNRVYWAVPAQGYIRWVDLDGSNPEYRDWSPDTPNDIIVRLDPGAPDGVGWFYFTSLYSTGGRIGKDGIDTGTGNWVIEERANTPMDLAFDPASNKLYWSEDGGGIYSIDADAESDDATTLAEIVPAAQAGSPRDLALDMANGKLYWVSEADSEIRRANLDGSGVEVLIDGLTTPRGIALDLRPR